MYLIIQLRSSRLNHPNLVVSLQTREKPVTLQNLLRMMMIIDLLKTNLLKNRTKITDRKDMGLNNKNFRINPSHKIKNRKSKKVQNNLEPLK
jgi:hypothetical protein